MSSLFFNNSYTHSCIYILSELHEIGKKRIFTHKIQHFYTLVYFFRQFFISFSGAVLSKVQNAYIITVYICKRFRLYKLI